MTIARLWVAPEGVRECVSRLLCDLVAIPSYGGQEGRSFSIW